MNTSLNRKYLTSTGILLNTLKEDQTNSYQSPPQTQMMSQNHHHQSIHHHQPPQQSHQAQSKINQQHQMQQSYQYQQQNFSNNFSNQSLQFQSNPNNYLNQPQQNQMPFLPGSQLVKSSPQLISQISPNTNQMEFYQMKMQQQQQTNASIHQSQLHTPSEFC